VNRPGDLALAVGPVARRLRELRIPFRVTGSVASAVRGVPRATMDVDLVAQIPASRVRSLLDALGDAYYGDLATAEAAARRGGSPNLIHEETMVKAISSSGLPEHGSPRPCPAAPRRTSGSPGHR
jgi:hypothetical protein